MRIAALALLALLAGSSTAAQPPPASDRQVLERATALRREATSLRAHADREEERRKPECHAAFQVNRCLKDAREAKLAEVRRARALERQAHQLELGVKRRQAAISAPASAERSLTPPPPLRHCASRRAPNNRFRKPPRGHRSQPSRPCRAGCSAAFSGTGGRGAPHKRRPIGSDTTPGCEATRRSNQRARQRNSGTGSGPAASRVASSTRPRPSVLAR